MNSLKTKQIYIVSVRAGQPFNNDYYEYMVAATSIGEARRIAILAGEDNNDFKRQTIMSTDVQEREQIFSL